jgi:hypothetical protein
MGGGILIFFMGEMGMGLFNRKKTNYVGEMRDYLKQFMLQYIKNNPHAADIVIPVFSNVETMIRGLSEKELGKMLKANNVNIECGVLNIVQNFAMTELKAKSGVEFLNSDDYARDLYKFVNDLKYKKGYISKQQHEENEMLGVKLSLQNPFGGWL